MNPVKNFIIKFLLAISLCCITFTPAFSQQLKNKEAGKPWEFQVKTFEGKTAFLPHHKGRVAIYVFQAFWCDTWKEVSQGYKTLKNEMNEVPCDFSAVCIDSVMPDETTVKKAMEESDYPIYTDYSGEISNYYKIKSVPTFMVFDKKNRLVFRHEGYPGNKMLKKLLIELNKP
ncbi:MAG: TlpA family protein disulfide reductase [Firmicutes bacterium]|nr:TlpA family protein disulfide reductase [Bacillota bacterium]